MKSLVLALGLTFAAVPAALGCQSYDLLYTQAEQARSTVPGSLVIVWTGDEAKRAVAHIRSESGLQIVDADTVMLFVMPDKVAGVVLFVGGISCQQLPAWISAGAYTKMVNRVMGIES